MTERLDVIDNDVVTLAEDGHSVIDVVATFYGDKAEKEAKAYVALRRQGDRLARLEQQLQHRRAIIEDNMNVIYRLNDKIATAESRSASLEQENVALRAQVEKDRKVLEYIKSGWDYVGTCRFCGHNPHTTTCMIGRIDAALKEGE